MCTVGEVELCFETFGDPGDPAVLLVMGLGTQMVWWRDGFCELLASRGFHVVRFDNRDVGRSSHLRHAPAPTPWQLLRRDARAAAYTLADMAGDCVGLLDHLGVDRAHVVGTSMGGMIAQTLAALHPQRVRSLVSIMSNTGSRWSGRTALRLYPRLLARPPHDRETCIEASVRNFRHIASPGFTHDVEEHRRLAGLSYDRMRHPPTSARQLAAIITAGDRTAMLRTIRVPTLVIHGTADRLVAPSGGRATARAIAGARLLMIEGMGHHMPRAVWPHIVDAIEHNAARAGAQELRLPAAD